MSFPPARGSLRLRVVEALQGYLGNNSARGVGKVIGVAGTTVSARGCDLQAWPAADLLTLAEQDEALGNALVATIRSECTEVHGEAVAIQSELLDELADDALVDGTIIEALRGKPSVEKRAAVKAQILRRRAHEDKLLADLEAAEGATRG